jgi:hypothetical protein
MKNGHDKYEILTDWLLSGALNLINDEPDEFSRKSAHDLQKAINKDDMDEIVAFFNALMFVDDSNEWAWKGASEIPKHGEKYMLGWENVEKIFSRTTAKYPSLCKTLMTYVYS